MNAKELKEKRIKLGFTQEELAIRLGVSKRTIINYEKGEVIPITKSELINNVLNELDINILNEPPENYIKVSPNEIHEIEEIISERKKIIELSKEQMIINHQ
jgi:transcriptional regulator with XRE-family HTH domain